MQDQKPSLGSLREKRIALVYKFLGTTHAAFLHNHLFRYLEDKIPALFYNRSICDLGCGDGVSTLRIKKLFRAKDIRGYELHDDLIGRARRRGLSVEKIDLEKSVSEGEMAVTWGVLHHLKNPRRTLSEIAKKYDCAFFCEPVHTWWSFTDGGIPLPEKGWDDLFSATLGTYRKLRCRDHYFVFWHRNY